MITVIKYTPRGEKSLEYAAQILAPLENGVVLDARWTRPRRDLGYTIFEPGDRFVEYFYTDRWFNIFAISSPDGRRKGWYCNIAAPARVSEAHVEQIDLLLDVWVDPAGQPLLLDEDEFAADTTLTDIQRQGATCGLQELLTLIAQRREPFFEPGSVSE
jgi:hypothetical protein